MNFQVPPAAVEKSPPDSILEIEKALLKKRNHSPQNSAPRYRLQLLLYTVEGAVNGLTEPKPRADGTKQLQASIRARSFSESVGDESEATTRENPYRYIPSTMEILLVAARRFMSIAPFHGQCSIALHPRQRQRPIRDTLTIGYEAKPFQQTQL